MYNVDLYTALLSSVCKELHIHIDNGISPLILSLLSARNLELPMSFDGKNSLNENSILL